MHAKDVKNSDQNCLRYESEQKLQLLRNVSLEKKIHTKTVNVSDTKRDNDYPESNVKGQYLKIILNLVGYPMQVSLSSLRYQSVSANIPKTIRLKPGCSFSDTFAELLATEIL